MSSLNSGVVCYHSVQNLLPWSLLSKHIKIKTYRTIILPVVLCGCEPWCLTLNEEHRLGVFKNSRVMRKIFWPKWDWWEGNGEEYIMRNFMICLPREELSRWSDKQKWNVWWMWLKWERRDVHIRFWWGDMRERTRQRWEDNIGMDLQEAWGGMVWIK